MCVCLSVGERKRRQQQQQQRQQQQHLSIRYSCRKVSTLCSTFGFIMFRGWEGPHFSLFFSFPLSISLFYLSVCVCVCIFFFPNYSFLLKAFRWPPAPVEPPPKTCGQRVPVTRCHRRCHCLFNETPIAAAAAAAVSAPLLRPLFLPPLFPPPPPLPPLLPIQSFWKNHFPTRVVSDGCFSVRNGAY